MQRIVSNKIVIQRYPEECGYKVEIYENNSDIHLSPEYEHVIDGAAHICDDGLLYIDGNEHVVIRVPEGGAQIFTENGNECIEAVKVNGVYDKTKITVPVSNIFLEHDSISIRLFRKKRYIKGGYYRLKTITIFNRIYSNFMIDNKKLLQLRTFD
jgi:hypothetical protein